MAEFPSTKSVPADISTKSDDANQLNQSDRRVGHSSPTKSTNTAEAIGNGIGNKAKSCKGCLYYSSRFKADSRNPLCVGLTRSLPNVPPYIVGQSEVEASKEGRNLTEFRYACVGYSLYKDRKGQAPNGQQPQAELPVCLGLEVLVDRRVNPSAEAAPIPAHVHNKIDGNDLPQRRTPKPTNAIGEEFFSRQALLFPIMQLYTCHGGVRTSTGFTRNANLVANGVAKNICKVGNQIKQGFDDIMYRRPK
ncbi:DHHC-type zinc finger family protein [Striga asiatica]|uniref:DHHC-type zinc finger family protein n=1 Tax=Striga asiatica TaxID=4170 RepID=A0A5A7PQ93_STRAF|nr:DHHC-type zinc finger family protein [Striga asiatica]